MLLVQRKEAAKLKDVNAELPSLTSLLVICRGFELKIVSLLKRQLVEWATRPENNDLAESEQIRRDVNDLRGIDFRNVPLGDICDIQKVSFGSKTGHLFEDTDEIELEPIPLEQPQIDS